MYASNFGSQKSQRDREGERIRKREGEREREMGGGEGEWKSVLILLFLSLDQEDDAIKINLISKVALDMRLCHNIAIHSMCILIIS